MLYRQHLIHTVIRRLSSSFAPRPQVTLTEDVRQSLDNDTIKPRKHPGINKSGTQSLPVDIVNAMVRATADFPIKTLLTEGATLSRFLNGRHPPIEQEELLAKSQEFREEYLRRKQLKVDGMVAEERQLVEQSAMDSVRKLLKRKVYNWTAIKYDHFKALQYLLARGPVEYAVLFKVFAEIKQRDPQFVPRGYFDFGSGVGSGVWAATNVWPKTDVFEYFLCDASKDMNDLSELVLRGGDNNLHLDYKNINYRQFLPASADLKYNLVLCAYSLFELNSMETRLKTLKTLWDKCEEYLVVVEQGTRAGFNLIMEARDFILSYDKGNATVFAPCPHESQCPRVTANDGTPCNFPIKYMSPGIGGPQIIRGELYSYVVLRKGPNRGEVDQRWPRIVRPVLVRKKHSICRFCTHNGKLEEVIFTASKQGKVTYHCARSSRWGDRLPINFNAKTTRADAEDESDLQ